MLADRALVRPQHSTDREVRDMRLGLLFNSAEQSAELSGAIDRTRNNVYAKSGWYSPAQQKMHATLEPRYNAMKDDANARFLRLLQQLYGSR